MDLSAVRQRRRKSLFRPWNSYLAKKGAVDAAPFARHNDARRANANAGLLAHATPLVRLTVNLIDTYEGINAAYYERRAAVAVPHAPAPPMPGAAVSAAGTAAVASTPDAAAAAGTSATGAVARTTGAASPLSIQYCDENFDYIVRTGEMFNNRYMLEKVIGRGSFGQVVRAYDTRDNTHVAIKIIKNNSLYVEQALSEVRMTSYLNRIDPDDAHSIMRLRDKFIFRGHQCLVLELLSFSLYDLLRSTEFYGVSLNLVRKFCKQILRCLAFLSRPDVNIAHCDLKPENVLLRHPQRSAIKVVDFGASCRISESMFVYVQSRFYRAPEVILGLPYGTQVDMWSLGCMLIELHTGYPLFAGKDEGDQMAIIVERLGLPPDHMLENGKKSRLFFDRDDASGTWSLKPAVSDEHGQSMPGSKSIEHFVDVHTGATNGRRKRVSGGHSEVDYEVFLSLAKKMLLYDPEKRMCASDALKDAFVRGGGTSASRSGRDSPPHMPALGAVSPPAAGDVACGRKAPVQRARAGGARKKVVLVHEATASDSEQASGTTPTRSSSGGGGEEENADVGGDLRASRSEPAMKRVGDGRAADADADADADEDAGGAPRFLFAVSDWAEEVGIEPPLWRSSGGVRGARGVPGGKGRPLGARARGSCAGGGGGAGSGGGAAGGGAGGRGSGYVVSTPGGGGSDCGGGSAAASSGGCAVAGALGDAKDIGGGGGVGGGGSDGARGEEEVRARAGATRARRRGCGAATLLPRGHGRAIAPR